MSGVEGTATTPTSPLSAGSLAMKRPFSPSLLDGQGAHPRALDFGEADGVDGTGFDDEGHLDDSAMESPSNLTTPPSSPPAAPPQTPSPKSKRSPSRSQYQYPFGSFGAQSEGHVDWMSDVPRITSSPTLRSRSASEEDSDGASPGQSPPATHPEVASAVPLQFNDSFVSNAGCNESELAAFVSPPQVSRKSAPIAPSTGLPTPTLKPTAAASERAGGLALKSPRPAKSALFGGVPQPEELNVSSIRPKSTALAASKGPNLSMPAPASAVGRRSPRGHINVPHLSLPPRSPKGVSQSMFVTGAVGGGGGGGGGGAGGGGEDDISNFSLHRQQQLSRTPRNNPYQLSPRSHLGSAKKKTRLSMVALSSRYVQDFDEEKRLGHGNFSDVYQCKHVRDGLQYAVKILRGEASDSSKVLREVWALSALTAHENVIRYYGCWMEDGKLYIQTEFCEEGNLEAKLLAGHSYAEAELVDMLRQVLSGVAHIHKAGLCHLDIKPENVLISMVRDGAVVRPVYKLADFGLVRNTNLCEDFLHDVEGGDGRFVSPELMEGDMDLLRGNLDKSDVWSVGCTVYALARRRDLPTGGDEYAEIRAGNLQLPEHEYSPEFVELLQKMVCPSVHQRMTAHALLDEPLLQTPVARDYAKLRKKKAKLEVELADRDKEVELLRLELQMARGRERLLADELQRARVDASKVETKLDVILSAVCGNKTAAASLGTPLRENVHL